MRVLVLADEWLSGRGGITALNRYLCAALSAAGVTVCGRSNRLPCRL
ncbi:MULTISPECIES: hypothetical protein [unclassified Frankia]